MPEDTKQDHKLQRISGKARAIDVWTWRVKLWIWNLFRNSLIFFIESESSLSIKLRNDVSDVSQLDARHQLHPWQAMGMNKPDHMVASKAEGIYIFDEK